MSRARSAISVVAAGLTASTLVVACSDLEAEMFEREYSSTRDASTGAVTPAAARPPLVECPRELPDRHERCRTSGLRCEYGDDVDARCNVFAECDGERFQWDVPRACTFTCPAERDDVRVGEPCGPPPVAIVAADDDAGAPDASAAEIGPEERLCSYGLEVCACTQEADGVHRWRCAPPDVGCPRERPRIGARCDFPRVCDYGACVFEHGLALECVTSSGSSVGSGVWLVVEPQCSPSSSNPSPATPENQP